MFFWLLVLLFLLPLFTIFLILEIKSWRQRKYIDRIAGPTKLPLFGNALQVGNNGIDILHRFFDWWREYKYENYRIWIGYRPYIFINNTKDVEYILTNKELQHKSDIYDMLHPWLGQGLLTSFGSTWFKKRKIITPSFHFQILQHFFEVMNENSTKLIGKLQEISRGDNIFDMQDVANSLTLDIICETAMGVEIHAMDGNDSEIVAAFRYICENINIRAFNPLKRNNMIYKFFPDYARYVKTLKMLEQFTKDVIEKRKATFELKNVEQTSDLYSPKKLAFLDTLLTATMDGRRLTAQEIYEEVSTFVFEGHDTVSSGIAFAIYLLSRHPKVQNKLLAEQLEIMGDNFKKEATFQQISNMKYLDLVIKEAQRLYPSVPIIGRITDKDFNINGTLIPEGVNLNIFLMALGYNERHFPDPYRFKPERFSLEQRSRDTNPFEYLPFSAGPRNCIGQKFALLELKTIISKVVRHFEILPPVDDLISKDGYVECYPGMSAEELRKRHLKPNKYYPLLSSVITLKSENGIQIRMKERC